MGQKGLGTTALKQKHGCGGTLITNTEEFCFPAANFLTLKNLTAIKMIANTRGISQGAEEKGKKYTHLVFSIACCSAWKKTDNLQFPVSDLILKSNQKQYSEKENVMRYLQLRDAAGLSLM
ncbi:hypothetical protein TNCV_891301 [Trichonephila clavipes]|nr:hypothetical protein TNCV_891301 [Trichonephila clavipes]